MNELQGTLPGATQLLLESLCYNAGLGWQKQVTLWVPLVVMIFLFTELLSKTEAKRKGNVICLILVIIGSLFTFFTLAQVNGRLLQDVTAPAAVVGSILAILLIAAVILTPLTMLACGAGYLDGIKAWSITLLTATGVVFASNIVWQLMKKSDIAVLAVEGTVKRQGSPIQWWSSLSGTNAALSVGTVFKTGPQDSVTLRLAGATVVSLQPNSVMSVRLSKGMPIAVLESGKLVGDVVPGQNQNFIIRTPAAYSGIIGTRFKVESDADKNTTTTVAEGSVKVAGTATGSSEVTVGSGKFTKVTKGGSPEDPKSANDEDLDDINRIFPQHDAYRR